MNWIAEKGTIGNMLEDGRLAACLEYTFNHNLNRELFLDDHPLTEEDLRVCDYVLDNHTLVYSTCNSLFMTWGDAHAFRKACAKMYEIIEPLFLTPIVGMETRYQYQWNVVSEQMECSRMMVCTHPTNDQYQNHYGAPGIRIDYHYPMLFGTLQGTEAYTQNMLPQFEQDVKSVLQQPLWRSWLLMESMGGRSAWGKLQWDHRGPFTYAGWSSNHIPKGQEVCIVYEGVMSHTTDLTPYKGKDVFLLQHPEHIVTTF